MINQNLPMYSYDGTTLIVKFDRLRIDGATAWLTLTRVEG